MLIDEGRTFSSSPMLHDPESSARRARWGLYPWFEERGEELIHPDDLETIRTLRPNGKVFHVTDAEDPFLRFVYGDISFRALPSLLCEIDVDVHGIGERVTLADGRVGEVVGVHWHAQRAEPMYQLRVAGKSKSKRYWNSDLID